MASSTSRAGVDAHVNEAQPKTNFRRKYLALDRTGSNEKQAFIYAAAPWDRARQPTIVEANLRLYTYGAWAAGHTIRVQRITSGWKPSTVRWNQRPTVVATNQVDVTVPANSGNTLIEVPITLMMQDVSNFGAFFGFRITLVAGTSAVQLHSSRTTQDGFQPALEVEWNSAPSAPVNLRPSGSRAVSLAGPVLLAEFVDDPGENQSAIQVQFDDSADLSTMLHDSGWVTKGETSYDLAAAGVTIPDDATRYWRIRARDVYGAESPWSSVVSFIRKTKGTLTITEPAAAVVNDATPTIEHTFDHVVSSSFTFDPADVNATDNTITETAHGLANGTRVRFTTTGTLPAGLTAGTVYYVVETAANTFKVSTTSGGAAVDITDQGTGVHTAEVVSIRTQRARKYIVWEADAAGVFPTSPRHESPVLNDTGTQYTLPEKVIRYANRDYRIEVRVWDTIERESTPGDRTYVSAERTFHLELGAVDPVTDLAAAMDTETWKVNVTWSRAVTPDYFAVVVDDEIVADLLVPADLSTGGTNYAYDLTTLTPGVSHDIEVHAIVVTGGVQARSGTNPTVSITPVVTGVWIVVPDEDLSVLITGHREQDQEIAESGETHRPIGRAKPVRTVDRIGGYDGTIRGQLSSKGGRTADQWLERLNQIKDLRNTVGARLIMGRFNFPIIVEEVGGPSVGGVATDYDIEVSFSQSGEFRPERV